MEVAGKATGGRRISCPLFRLESAENHHWDRPESRFWPIADAQYHPPEDRPPIGPLLHRRQSPEVHRGSASPGFFSELRSLSLSRLASLLLLSPWFSFSLCLLISLGEKQKRRTKGEERRERGKGLGLSPLRSSLSLSPSLSLSLFQIEEERRRN